jgi:hypothetical protein
MSDAYWNSYNNALGAADKVRQNALARQAGGMIASGDTMGARNALYRGGDLANGGVMDTRIANDRKTKAEAASKWAQGLSRMMDDPRFANDPNAAYEAALPYAQKLGLDPQEAEADRQLFVRDPKGYASMLLEKAGKELQFFQTDQGIYVGDKGTGEVSQAARLPGKPQMFGDFLYVPEGEADAPTPRVGTPGFNPNAPDPRRPSTGGFNSVIDPLLKREGGFVARDGRSGAPANFGINQKYNPDVDVRNLTPDKAKELYRSRYWNAIDGDNLPPEAQAAVFDAAVNQGPQRATQWWQQSGGDLAKFNQLRLQHYRSRPDYAQNGRSWEARVAETSGQQPLQGGAGGDDLGAAPTIPGMRAVGRVKSSGARKQYRPATAAEKAAYGLPPDVPAKIDSDGNIDVISGVGANNKRVPPKIASGYTANKTAITQIDQAIAEIKANKGALGLKNYLGDDVNQRLDPAGVGVRASVANIGSLKRHDRSGATVTAAESPILKPFIPSVTDSADAAITKLTKLRQEYENTNAEIDIEFGEESGYAPMGKARAAPPAPAAAPARPAATAKAASGSPPASALKAGHITTFANGQRWTLRNGKPARVQ